MTKLSYTVLMPTLLSPVVTLTTWLFDSGAVGSLEFNGTTITFRARKTIAIESADIQQVIFSVFRMRIVMKSKKVYTVLFGDIEGEVHSRASQTDIQTAQRQPDAPEWRAALTAAGILITQDHMSKRHARLFLLELLIGLVTLVVILLVIAASHFWLIKVIAGAAFLILVSQRLLHYRKSRQ